MTTANDDANEGTRRTVIDPECLTTKELLRRQRKAEYEKAKASRKSDRLQEKSDKADARTKARAERDAELWSALKKAKNLDKAVASPDATVDTRNEDSKP